MGRDAKVTYEQVAAAADAMCAANLRPSSRALREKLGNTGSMGTINRLRQEWKATQERHQVPPVTLPAVLQRAILDFMAHELSTAKSQLEYALEEQHHEMTDRAIENERQAADIDERVNAEVALRADLAKSQGRIAHTEEELAQARRETSSEREEASKVRVDLAKALLRLEAMPRLEAEIAALREELRRVFLDRTAATQQAAVLEATMRVSRGCSIPPIPPRTRFKTSTRFKKSSNDHEPAILPLRTRVFSSLAVRPTFATTKSRQPIPASSPRSSAWGMPTR